MRNAGEGIRSSGAYVLVIDLARDQRLVVGKLGEFRFPAGTYAYVGSAMGGLGGRLGRHLNPGRKVHWHIDRLTRAGTIRGAFVIPSMERQECALSDALGHLDGSNPMCPGFGCSDCNCITHLFRVEAPAISRMGRLYGAMLPAEILIRQSSRR
ncbi:MAG: GIY-YIG nuclease family protein [Methanomassiliicoccales archaeon]|nr:GIY-YIG nuclease family protein [Methanomassiliicoccales archaeon]